MDLLLLLKSGWTLIEVGLSLPQCLCTFGKEKGFSLINPPTTFTIKGREWNRIFFAVDLDSSILGHFSQYSWHLLFAAWQNFSELLWGGKAKASTGDGQKSQAQEPGGAGCFILCNLETNQVPFIFFGICSASTELVNSESTLGRNVGWELQFTEASSCPWPLHFSTCTGCWVLLLNASLELRRDEKLSIIKRIAFQMKINTNPPIEASRATCSSIQMWEQRDRFVIWGLLLYITVGTLHIYQSRDLYCKCIAVLTSKCWGVLLIIAAFPHSFIFLLIYFLAPDLLLFKLMFTVSKTTIALTGIKFRCKFTWGRRELKWW